MLAVIDDFLFRLRREGFRVAISQALDVARVTGKLGVESRALLAHAWAAILVDDARQLTAFHQHFEHFFSAKSAASSDRQWSLRLARLGFTQDELELVRTVLEAAGVATAEEPLLHPGSSLDHLFSNSEAASSFRRLYGPLQAGLVRSEIAQAIDVTGHRLLIEQLHRALAGAYGGERAAVLRSVLEGQLEAALRDLRALVDQRACGPSRVQVPSRSLRERDFSSLSAAELSTITHAVRLLALRLAGAARARRKRALRGGLDRRRTAQAAARTDGIPFHAHRRVRRRDKPRLLVLCDVSDSVQVAAELVLAFVSCLQSAFATTRTYAFTSDTWDITPLVTRSSRPGSLGWDARGKESHVGHSNYARALAQFERQTRDLLDHRTTLVIVGDGRTNHRASGADVLRRLRSRARRVLWLCPEPMASWGVGDSGMHLFGEQVDSVLEVTSASSLERAARALLRSSRPS